MRPFEKYDPEDIESLLITKQFSELYPEEKEFVLRHLSDEEQYNSMRKMLIEIREISKSDDLLTPDAAIKKNLMAEFNREKKGRFSIWLNSLFASPDVPWFRQSGVQIAFGVAIVLIGIFGILPNFNQDTSSVYAETKKEAQSDKSNALADTTALAEAQASKVTVDTTGKGLLPQKPVVLAMVQEESKNKVVEFESTRSYNDEAPAEPAIASAEEYAESDNIVSNSTAPASETIADFNLSDITKTPTTLSKSKEQVKTESIAKAAVPESLASYNGIVDLLFTAR